ncbi:unnamed protein product [Penicillium glandicola]
MPQFLLVLNALTSFASAAAAIISTAKPESMSGSPHVTNGELFYQRLGPAVSSAIAAAAFVQAADAVIGIGKKDAGIILGASLSTVVHVICFFSVNKS